MPIQTSQQCEVDSEQSKKQAYRFKAKHGFTLIELLVVVGIIGILTALGAVSYSAAQLRARDTQRKSDIASYQTALECYFAKQNYYPTADVQGSLQAQNINCLNANVFFKDPKTSSRYKINLLNVVGSKAYGYQLIACLENANDPQKDAAKDAYCSAANGYLDSTYPASYTKYNP